MASRVSRWAALGGLDGRLGGLGDALEAPGSGPRPGAGLDGMSSRVSILSSGTQLSTKLILQTSLPSASKKFAPLRAITWSCPSAVTNSSPLSYLWMQLTGNGFSAHSTSDCLPFSSSITSRMAPTVHERSPLPRAGEMYVGLLAPADGDLLCCWPGWRLEESTLSLSGGVVSALDLLGELPEATC